MPIAAARPAGLTSKPFRGSVAIKDGLITRAQLRGAGWRRLFRDVYVDATVRDDHLLRIAGAALLLPVGAAISGRSAAVLWGVRRDDYDGAVEVLTARRFGPVHGMPIRVGPLAGESIPTDVASPCVIRCGPAGSWHGRCRTSMRFRGLTRWRGSATCVART